MKCGNGVKGIRTILVLAILAIFTISVSAENIISVAQIKVESRTLPLGIDEPAPHFSWILQSSLRDQVQSAYQILVADSYETLESNRGNIWDSGKILSDETVQITFKGSTLESGKPYYWKVRVWDKADRVSEWSAAAHWEMGLLNPSDWRAKWIGDGKVTPADPVEFYKDDPAPLFRKEFSATKNIKKARLFITAAGYYEAHINGNRVGDYCLDPGWTDYRKRILYSTYDVTKNLQNGDNVIGVTIGNGWYNPLPMKMWGRYNLRDALAVGRPCFIAQLEIEYADGSRQTVISDDSWQVKAGPVLRNNIYLGEIYDARLEIPGWITPRFNTSGWDKAVIVSGPGGKLQSQNQPPIRITARLQPLTRTEPEAGVYIFDMGQNFAGWVRLKVSAPAGQRITLRYGELLNADGTLNPMTSVAGQLKGLKDDGVPKGGPGAPEIAWQSDTYITRGEGIEFYQPRFTFHAFRYVEISGYPGVPAMDVLEGLRLNSDLEKTGTFLCSNPLFNRIQEMTEWTFLSNVFSVQSDCPHRERFGYGGDIAATSDAFIYNFDMSTFYTKSVRDWQDAARPDGMFTDTAPFVGIQYCGVGWARVHPLLLLQLWKYYGNRTLIREQYPAAKRWMEQVNAQSVNHLMPEGLSDHESLEKTDKTQMVTPLYYQSVTDLSRLAEISDHPEDFKEYTALAGEINQAYLDSFFRKESGLIESFTQGSMAFALFSGLLPESARQQAVDSLAQMIRHVYDGHLTTGIFGTRFLLDVLSRFGQENVAYEIVNQTTFPGWGHMLANGATTLWEHWELSENTYSHNHPMFGSVSEWFFKWLAGIQQAEGSVGFEQIIIHPVLPQGLTWVKASHRSVRGEIISEWYRQGNRFELDLYIPVNTSATVFLPALEMESIREGGKNLSKVSEVDIVAVKSDHCVLRIGSGTYHFSSGIR